MGVGSQIADRMSRALAVLTVIALAVRFAIPAGAMLEKPADAGGMPTLVVCTSAGMITVKAEGFGIPGKPDSKQQDNGKSGEPCTFSALGASLLAPAFVFIDMPRAVFAAVLPWIAVWQRPGLGLVAPPPPSTGPPSLI
jgi:hypothetical protein